MRQLHDQEAWPDAAPAHHARERRRVDGGSCARVVAERLQQALDVAAGRFSLLVWPDPDPGDDRRSAGAVHLRDLLTWTTTARCSPARHAAARSRRTGPVSDA